MPRSGPSAGAMIEKSAQGAPRGEQPNTHQRQNGAPRPSPWGKPDPTTRRGFACGLQLFQTRV